MALNQISDEINEVLAPNELGQATTLGGDGKLVDEGINFADLTINDLKGYAEGFISEFIQKFINDRKFEDDTFGLYRDGQEFGAGFALASTKSRMLAHDSHILDLEDDNTVQNAPDYTDGHFYNTEFDNKLYTKISTYKLKYSLSDEQLRKTFKESSSIEQFKAKVQLLALNTIASYNRDLAKAILQKIIVNASTSRNVNLTTLYNTANGFTSGDEGFVSDGTEAIHNNLAFKMFVLKSILRMPKQFKSYSKDKYNEDVETFCRKEDVNTVILEEISTMFDLIKSGTYNPEYLKMNNIYEIDSWQNSSTALLPYIADGSVQDQVKEAPATAGGDPTVVNHVIAICMDKYGAGITSRINKTTSKYVPEEDFVTFFMHLADDFWLDTRNVAVIFTL